MDIYDASNFLKEYFNVDIKPEPLRMRLKKYGLLTYANDGFHVDIHSKDLEKFGKIVSSDMSIAGRARMHNLSYNKLHYACMKLRVDLIKKYGRLLFKNMEDIENVIRFCENSQKKNKK